MARDSAFVAAQVGAQRPDVSHAYHNPIVSKNPWLNKNSWFPEVMGGHWNSSSYVTTWRALRRKRSLKETLMTSFPSTRQQRVGWL